VSGEIVLCCVSGLLGWLMVRVCLPSHVVCHLGTIPLIVLGPVPVQVSTVNATVFSNKTVLKCKFQKVEKEVLSTTGCVCSLICKYNPLCQLQSCTMAGFRAFPCSSWKPPSAVGHQHAYICLSTPWLSNTFHPILSVTALQLNYLSKTLRHSFSSWSDNTTAVYYHRL
jgi:hypothetical protein